MSDSIDNLLDAFSKALIQRKRVADCFGPALGDKPKETLKYVDAKDALDLALRSYFKSIQEEELWGRDGSHHSDEEEVSSFDMDEHG